MLSLLGSPVGQFLQILVCFVNINFPGGNISSTVNTVSSVRGLRGSIHGSSMYSSS